jgi:hypothetical protein
MAIRTGDPENVEFPRPLPHPAAFAWATWVASCGLAYWTYVEAARGGVSIPLSLGFWAIVIVVVPVMIRRAREPLAGLMAAMLTLLGYVVLMNDVLR